MGIILTLLAILLSWILFPVGLLYTFIRLVFGVNIKEYFYHINKTFYSIALSIDQLGNVVLQYLMNDFLITKDGERFGDPDRTISYVLGVNKRKNTLTYLGSIIVYILNTIDKDHVEKAK